MYGLALRLREQGVGDDLMAQILSVEPEALSALFELAEAKLTALLQGRVP